MPNAGVGRDEHARAGEPRPPAQVDVVGARERRGVEAAELVEEVGADEHDRVRDEEDVAHGVVLFLVDLAGLDARERDAVVVDRHPDLEQHLGVVVVDELGPDDAGVRAVRLLDHHADRIRLEHDIVVAEEQEGRALHERHRVVRGRREADVRVQPAHEGPRHRGRDPRRRVVGRAVVEHEHRQRGVLLGREARERVLQPRTGVARDEDRDDSGSDFRGDLVGSDRLRGIRFGRIGVRAPSSSSSMGGGRRSAPGVGSGVSMGRARIAARAFVPLITSACNC